jgi:hypothetical protein
METCSICFSSFPIELPPPHFVNLALIVSRLHLFCFLRAGVGVVWIGATDTLAR